MINRDGPLVDINQYIHLPSSPCFQYSCQYSKSRVVTHLHVNELRWVSWHYVDERMPQSTWLQQGKAKAQTALEISHTFAYALYIQNTTGALCASMCKVYLCLYFSHVTQKVTFGRTFLFYPFVYECQALKKDKKLNSSPYDLCTIFQVIQ